MSQDDERLERLERRLNEAHDRLSKLEGQAETLKTTVTRWQNRLQRLFHYFKIGLDEEDPRAPTRRRS